MKHFHLHAHQWFAENCPLSEIAKRVGTPCYVYSRAAIETAFSAFKDALRVWQPKDYQLNYAVKANSNIAILNNLARLGSGFDIVSGGELARVLKAGTAHNKILFSGVGKTAEEIKQALELGIGCINVESRQEYERIVKIASGLNKKAPIAFRVNPDVETHAHPYIQTGHHANKFGIPVSEVLNLCQEANREQAVLLKGLAFHIGSQVMELDPFIKALDKMIRIIEQLKVINIDIKELNVGGGLGVSYHEKDAGLSIESYIGAICDRLKDYPGALHLEPGRALVAEAGVLLTTVEYIKPKPKNGDNHKVDGHSMDKHFAIVDAAMNDLIRPALYQAWHEILPIVENEKGEEGTEALGVKACYDIVGPICESGDFLGQERMLSIQPNDVLAIFKTGAYGFSMSSNYNSRPRLPEVMVDKDKFYIIRNRETVSELFEGESLLPDENF